MAGKLVGFLVLVLTAVPSAGRAQAAPAQTAPTEAPAEQPGITRTTLQQENLSTPGREAIQVRVDFAPGAASPRHKHPGEEIVYVLAGTLQYRIEGQPTAILKAGDVLFIPAGVVHAAVNTGFDTASELATYVVEKGKPLVVPVK
jgi:quercetin dioxygenase-like cupin family protein